MRYVWAIDVHATSEVSSERSGVTCTFKPLGLHPLMALVNLWPGNGYIWNSSRQEIRENRGKGEVKSTAGIKKLSAIAADLGTWPRNPPCWRQRRTNHPLCNRESVLTIIRAGFSPETRLTLDQPGRVLFEGSLNNPGIYWPSWTWRGNYGFWKPSKIYNLFYSTKDLLIWNNGFIPYVRFSFINFFTLCGLISKNDFYFIRACKVYHWHEWGFWLLKAVHNISLFLLYIGFAYMK